MTQNRTQNMTQNVTQHNSPNKLQNTQILHKIKYKL